MTSTRHKSGGSTSPPSDAPAAALAHPFGPGTLSPADDSYLDAAREAILAVGWSRTTLTDIARRAGVSRMTLYRRWPDMQTMLSDLMTREWGEVLGAATDLTGAQAQPEGTAPIEQITVGIVAAVRALRDNALLRRIIELDPELLLPYLLDRRGRSQELIAHVLADLVRKGQTDGSVREGDADRLARSLLLACHGFALSAHTMVDEPAASREHGLRQYDSELAHLVERFLTR